MVVQFVSKNVLKSVCFLVGVFVIAVTTYIVHVHVLTVSQGSSQDELSGG